MRIDGPRRNPSPARTIFDGQALAWLLFLAICAERFDRARGTIQSLRSSDTPAPAEREQLLADTAPGWLWPCWVAVAVAGALVAVYVGARAIRIAQGLKEDRTANTGSTASVPRRLPWLVYGSVVVWLAWQVTGIVVVAGASIPSWISFVLHLAVGAALIGALSAGGAVTGNLSGARERASVVRLQLIFLLVLFLVVFIAPFTAAQLTDVLRAWGDEGAPASRPVAGIAAALLLGAVCRASATRLLIPSHRRLVRLPRSLSSLQPKKHADRIAGALAALLVIALLIAGLEAPAFVAFAVGAIAVLTRREPSHDAAPGTKAEHRSLRRLAGTLGVVPLAILLVGIVGATVDSLMLPDGPRVTDRGLLGWAAAIVIGFGLLSARAHAATGAPGAEVEDRIVGWVPRNGWVSGIAGIAGLGAGLLMRWEPDAGAWLMLALGVLLAFKALGERGAPELWGGWGVALGVAATVYAEPIESARAIGAFGLALLGATGILVGLHLAGRAGHRRLMELRGRTRQAPVVLVLVVWAVVAWFTTPPTAHQARTIAAHTEPGRLDSAVTTWLERQAPARGSKRPRELPMLIVAASGGGTKAAYWTDLVLDCVFGSGTPPKDADECAAPGRERIARRRWRSLLLTSSVSGGSIGIHQLIRSRPQILRGDPWVARTAGRDLLSPLVAWGMFHDLPSILLGLPTDPGRCDKPLECPLNADRPLVQEVAVDDEDRSAAPRSGLLDQKGPIVVFNATDLEQDRRVVLSRLSLASPARCRDRRRPLIDAIDGHDLLDGDDVAMVTATLLSARFPLLQPAGRLGRSSGEQSGVCRKPPAAAVSVRDGGLIENTGLLTVVELLPTIQRTIALWKRDNRRRAAGLRVRPIVLSIDDDVPRVGGDNEYSRFPWGASRNRSMRSRDLLNGCEFPGVAYERISPRPHVGAQAASGFEISRTSRREDLGDSLRTGAAGTALRGVRDMLDGRMPVRGCRQR